ncbi:MAG: hypothetical protein COA69_13685 [Robiginitomaculum sp.]|nr:MAG: hypothetical protein COA69_13685 [Robiginitomaculum sp.]
MKIIHAAALTGVTFLASATSAFAHTGEHSASFFANIGHWLSSPSHALFSVIGGAIAAYILVKIFKSKNA